MTGVTGQKEEKKEEGPFQNKPCFNLDLNTYYDNARFLKNTKFPLSKQTLFDIPGEKFIGVGLDVTATSGKQLFPQKKTKSFYFN